MERAAYEELHFRNLLVNFFHELNDEVDKLVLKHLLGVEVCDEEGNVVSLLSCEVSGEEPCEIYGQRTLTGFLLRMKKDSARCVRKRVNLWTRMCSISSACLILMLTRMLLTLGSIKTRSFSLRETVKGFKRTSGEVWASISGTLWRSDAWEAKLDSDMAAVNDDRTHCRYGRSDCD